MDLFVLFGMQLAIGAGFAAFYLKQDARLRLLERRLNALARRVELWKAEHEAVAAAAAAPRASTGDAPRELGVRLSSAVAASATGEVVPIAREEAPTEEPLERILRLARAGRSAGEIARATGRGRGEIELLLRLHPVEQPVAPRSGSGSRLITVEQGVEDDHSGLDEKGGLARLERRPARRAARAG